MEVSSEQVAVLAERVTIKVPAPVYLCDGFATVDTGLPSPKFQLQVVIAEPLPFELLVKCTVSLTQVILFAVKEAIGECPTETMVELVAEHPDEVAVNTTV